MSLIRLNFNILSLFGFGIKTTQFGFSSFLLYHFETTPIFAASHFALRIFLENRYRLRVNI